MPGRNIAVDENVYKETLTVRKMWLAFATCWMLASGSALFAQDLKIGFVSTERVFREAPPAVKALKKLEKEFAPREAEMKKVAEDAQALQLKLEKEGMIMSASQRRDREAELGRMTRDLQRMQREFREDLNLRKNQELESVVQGANKVIKEIAEKENYDLILQEAVYRSPRLDITDKVIKALGDK
jgi:outer membrane protein